MFNTRYNIFVKASDPSETVSIKPSLSGEQVKEIYLEEIKDAKNNTSSALYSSFKPARKQKVLKLDDISVVDLYKCVQNNDVDMLRNILDSCPSLVNRVDEFGWSLLMIACQANSVDAAKELLKRGVDTSVRDKGGNSATSLVIRNKNLEIADLLIDHRKNNFESSRVSESPIKTKIKKVKGKSKEVFTCEICSKEFLDRDEHLASTVHNISASKDKKIPTNYVIPQTNRGYQIMLKVGWDRESGLGRDGSGNKFPIKAVQKTDRKGLGHDKRKIEVKTRKEAETCKNSKLSTRESRNERRMEINFRREFY